MKKIALLLLPIIACISCKYDYDIGSEFTNFKPKVVLNSIITPDSVIKIDLVWSKQYLDKTDDYQKVEKFDAELYEDGVLIEKGEYQDGLMLTSIFPKEGKSYNIKINVPNYGEVKAKTNIPKPINTTAHYKQALGSSKWSTYHHIEVSSIAPQERVRSAWIRTYAEYMIENETEIYEIKRSNDLYSNNAFAYQLNAVTDKYEVAYKGSEIGYEFFMRIPYVNISNSLPVNFSVLHYLEANYTHMAGENEWGYPIYENKKALLKTVCVEVTSPSDDYDKHCKSRYKQTILDSPDLPFFIETVNVYSNVENGLGIFAGCSVTLIKLAIE